MKIEIDVETVDTIVIQQMTWLMKDVCWKEIFGTDYCHPEDKEYKMQLYHAAKIILEFYGEEVSYKDME